MTDISTLPQPCSSKVGTSPSSPRPRPTARRHVRTNQSSMNFNAKRRVWLQQSIQLSYLGGEFNLGKAGDVVVHMAIVFLHLEVDFKSSMLFFIRALLLGRKRCGVAITRKFGLKYSQGGKISPLSKRFCSKYIVLYTLKEFHSPCNFMDYLILYLHRLVCFFSSFTNRRAGHSVYKGNHTT